MTAAILFVVGFSIGFVAGALWHATFGPQEDD
jgi:hypothetical protein